jgi:hypothetical protein
MGDGAPIFSYFLFFLLFSAGSSPSSSLSSFLYSPSSFFMGLNGLALMGPNGLVGALDLLIYFFLLQ